MLHLVSKALSINDVTDKNFDPVFSWIWSVFTDDERYIVTNSPPLDRDIIYGWRIFYEKGKRGSKDSFLSFQEEIIVIKIQILLALLLQDFHIKAENLYETFSDFIDFSGGSF